MFSLWKKSEVDKWIGQSPQKINNELEEQSGCTGMLYVATFCR